MNGAFEGYFPGRRGLWQGDPLSSYLFVVAMEVLMRMLNRPSSGFRYHPKCEKVGLTHIYLANDVMIFSSGDVASLSFIKASLASFGKVVGLVANTRKS